LVFQILTDRLFLTPINLSNLARQTAVLGVAAAATSLVIIMGEFDLAIGAAQALTTSIFGVLLIGHGWSVPAAIVLTVVVGVGLGLLEGLLIVSLSRLGFSVASFIITLGGMLAYGGLALLVLPESISPMPRAISRLNVDAIPARLALPLIVVAALLLAYPRLVRLARRRSTPAHEASALVVIAVIAGVFCYVAAGRGLPILLVITLACAAFLDYLTQATIFGRHMYAIGGNRPSARLVGIRVGRTILISFAVLGAFYGLLGILSAARLNAAVPSVGRTLALQAIASAAIGGVSLVGGRGRPSQALLGALVISSLANGLQLLNVLSLWQDIMSGVVLVLAVFFD
ncbi:MAG TPA: hypothetical protein VFX03_03470, partial [Thermomicrobiales bacterium]|nr:hypothetical protein [Thermomicrobiales bacterium]